MAGMSVPPAQVRGYLDPLTLSASRSPGCVSNRRACLVSESILR